MPRKNENALNQRQMNRNKNRNKTGVPRDRYGLDIMRLCIELNVPMPRDSWSAFDWNNHYSNQRKPKRNRGGGYRGR